MTKQKKYKSKLSLIQTEKAIKFVKSIFQELLSEKLCLTRVSAPLFVKSSTGLNDDLNGVEKSVDFQTKCKNSLQIVQSLAKRKRFALQKYGFKEGEGLYTDMNAIRKDDDLDSTHSYYVDQWDWEKVIFKEDRNLTNLKIVVQKVYSAIKETEKMINEKYGIFQKKLPGDIYFITSQELEDLYPSLLPEKREYEIVKKYKAVFISQIGGSLRSGKPHDFRAPDYDDWKLNGDIIVWNEVLQNCLELSSMGIRVDESSLIEQLEKLGKLEKKELFFHQKLLNGQLPYTVGGGIGQSRLCMFFLEKLHIGEVQSSFWTDKIIEECKKLGINLL